MAVVLFQLTVLINAWATNFPFHLLETFKDVVFEDESFHDTSCKNNKYLLFDINTCKKVNPSCSALANNKQLTNIITNANDPDKHSSTTKSEYLTFNQLNQRLLKTKSQLNEQKLKSLDVNRKLLNLNNLLPLPAFISLYVSFENICQYIYSF